MTESEFITETSQREQQHRELLKKQTVALDRLDFVAELVTEAVADLRHNSLDYGNAVNRTMAEQLRTLVTLLQHQMWQLLYEETE